MELATTTFQTKSFVERATVIWSEYGTIKGHQATIVTGHFETRPIPGTTGESDEDRMEVFVPGVSVTREATEEELAALIGAAHAELVADAASKGARAAERRERIVELEQALREGDTREAELAAALHLESQRAANAEERLAEANRHIARLERKSVEEPAAD